MRILIIRNYPSYMAVKNNTYNIQELGLAKALTRRGHQCDILFWTDRIEESIRIPVDIGGEVTVFYRKGITFLKNTVYRHCDALFSGYDILQTAEYNQMQSWLLAKVYPQKTVVYHGPYHCEFNKRYNAMCKVFDAFFLHRYLKMGTRFITKSCLAKEFLLSKGIEEENITVAGVGLDAQMLSSLENKDAGWICKSMEENESGIKLLYIGRIEPRRNPLFLIDVLRKVSVFEQNVKLYVVGDGTENDLRDFFSYAEQSGVREKIEWRKKMEQRYLSQIYEKADFFLLPTRYEIFGMVLLEAMYFEKVVLTTANGGSEMLIRDGENGLVMDAVDADAWAENIARLHKDKNKKARIQSSARETVLTAHMWDNVCESFEKVYTQMQTNE